MSGVDYRRREAGRRLSVSFKVPTLYGSVYQYGVRRRGLFSDGKAAGAAPEEEVFLGVM